LYEIVIGTPPFYDVDIERTYWRIAAADLVFPTAPRLSAECRLLIKRLLHPDPAKRPSAADVLTSSWMRIGRRAKQKPPKSNPHNQTLGTAQSRSR
jgi:serine/threonine protein kinase